MRHSCPPLRISLIWKKQGKSLNQFLPKISQEIVSLDEASNRILSEDLQSLVDDPPFDNSAMDGFAVRYEDSYQAPITLKITQSIQAQGLTNLPTIMKGEACSITTGSPIPQGSDAIIPIEKCQINGNEVTLTEPSKPHFIRKRGENIAKGDVGLSAGARLTPSRISLCATMGHQNLKVVKPLTIAIISTGNELKSPENLRIWRNIRIQFFRSCEFSQTLWPYSKALRIGDGFYGFSSKCSQ